jgi:cell division protein FtsB
MILYGSLIIMLFVLLIVGAGLLLHAREKEHQEEMKELQRENDYLRDKVNQLSAHKLL